MTQQERNKIHHMVRLYEDITFLPKCTKEILDIITKMCVSSLTDMLIEETIPESMYTRIINELSEIRDNWHFVKANGLDDSLKLKKRDIKKLYS